MKTKKLHLSKETLKSLSEPQLNQAVGGMISNLICTLLECPSIFIDCPTIPNS